MHALKITVVKLLLYVSNLEEQHQATHLVDGADARAEKQRVLLSLRSDKDHASHSLY